MNEEVSRDAAAEVIFAERENVVRRTRSLDAVEKMLEEFTDEQLDTVLDMADVFMKAAQMRAQKLGRRGPPGPPGMPGRSPCGK
jgi:hypothetical protein